MEDLEARIREVLKHKQKIYDEYLAAGIAADIADQEMLKAWDERIAVIKQMARIYEERKIIHASLSRIWEECDCAAKHNYIEIKKLEIEIRKRDDLISKYLDLMETAKGNGDKEIFDFYSAVARRHKKRRDELTRAVNEMRCETKRLEKYAAKIKSDDEVYTHEIEANKAFRRAKHNYEMKQKVLIDARSEMVRLEEIYNKLCDEYDGLISKVNI